jgi:hypothetical protein
MAGFEPEYFVPEADALHTARAMYLYPGIEKLLKTLFLVAGYLF